MISIRMLPKTFSYRLTGEIRSESGEKFPVYSSARQICAVRVLESFYRFKLEQLYIVNQRRLMVYRDKCGLRLISNRKHTITG